MCVRKRRHGWDLIHLGGIEFSDFKYTEYHVTLIAAAKQSFLKQPNAKSFDQALWALVINTAFLSCRISGLEEIVVFSSHFIAWEIEVWTELPLKIIQAL